MQKKILVVGGGGREHAIIKALKKSPDCGEIWCAPGNGGISYDAKCKNIKATGPAIYMEEISSNSNKNALGWGTLVLGGKE